MPDLLSLEQRVDAAESQKEAAYRAFEQVPKQQAKGAVMALFNWNDAARRYFTTCIEAFLTTKPRTRFSGNAGYAADWLKSVADHYEAIRNEASFLRLIFADLNQAF